MESEQGSVGPPREGGSEGGVEVCPGLVSEIVGAATEAVLQGDGKQTLEREALYAKVPPPGDHIPCNVPTTDISDDAPKD